MRISKIKPNSDFTLQITFDDKTKGVFDVTPYLDCEAFRQLNNIDSFKSIKNGGYFVEWKCGADLSADTIKAKLKNL